MNVITNFGTRWYFRRKGSVRRREESSKGDYFGSIANGSFQLSDRVRTYDSCVMHGHMIRGYKLSTVVADLCSAGIDTKDTAGTPDIPMTPRLILPCLLRTYSLLRDIRVPIWQVWSSETRVEFANNVTVWTIRFNSPATFGSAV